MPTRIFAVVVDPGPPNPHKLFLHTGREGAVVAAVREALIAVGDSHVSQGPVVVEDFLETAAREQWEDAFSLLPRVIKALAGRRFPRIYVKKMDAVDNGEVDEAAMKILARNLLSNFRSG